MQRFFKNNIPLGIKVLYRSTKIYIKELKVTKRLYPDSFSIRSSLRCFFQWHQSLQPGVTPLSSKTPWITFPAIRFLESFLRPDMRVYEYGSGGSTLFFADRVSKVISVEHNSLWSQQVTKQIQRYGYTNSQILLIPADREPVSDIKDPSDPGAYFSSDGHYYSQYAMSIREYPAEFFDVILIDGRARPSCFMHALPNIKKEGVIVWDNTDRLHYEPAMRLTPNTMCRIDLPGSAPCLTGFTKTSLWCNGANVFLLKNKTIKRKGLARCKTIINF